MKSLLCLSLLLALPSMAQKATEPEVYDNSIPEPTYTEVKYGEHERHLMDVWLAKSDKPTPMVFVIHGGGWMAGSKARMSRFADAPKLLKQGISVVAINYRLIRHAGGVVPPVKAPLHDAARALQFVRSRATEWNIDKERIGAAGGSAGACSSLWLAFHNDMANPRSEDPVARESSRLFCAAVIGAQTTLDPKQMVDWTPNSKYGGHAFGKKDFKEFLESRDEIMPWIKEFSPYHSVSKDDPPVALFYKTPPNIGKPERDPTHTSNFGLKLQEHCKAKGVACVLIHHGVENPKFSSPTDYLISKLNAK